MEGLTFTVEKFTSIKDEMEHLFLEHWAEIANYQDRWTVNPDWERYKAMEDAGLLHCVIARMDGEIIGYFLSFVMRHMHYSDCVYAMNDVVFIRRSFRKSGAGIRLIRFAMAKLKELGAHRLCLHVKVQHDFGPMLERIGFECTEKNYEVLL